MHDVFINGGYGYDYPGGSGTWGNAPPAITPCTFPHTSPPHALRPLSFVPATEGDGSSSWQKMRSWCWATSSAANTMFGLSISCLWFPHPWRNSLSHKGIPSSLSGLWGAGDGYVVLAAANVLTRSFLLSTYYTEAHVTVWPSYVCGNNKNKWWNMVRESGLYTEKEKKKMRKVHLKKKKQTDTVTVFSDSPVFCSA